MGMTAERIAIHGYRDSQVEATLEKTGGNELAVLLPGLRYRTSMPLLYYAGALMRDRGADILDVHFVYDGINAFLEASEEEQLAWIAADGRKVFETTVGLGRYDRITVIGKSLGTIAMGWSIPDEPGLSDAALVWLTPSVLGTGLLERMRRCPQRSICILGTTDPGYSEDLLPALNWDGMTLAVVPGADHGFDRAEGVVASVEAVREAMEHLSAWVNAGR
ncbi:hypothetical protein HBA54_02560 [Pelagibius litoralis]|uniref:Alpha/beta hydrolase n=1 Tax=Pelagibius litoralis TaxID=374515 RepID=A0A967C301_9PROT|nr:hypothetical protein [Pelagibius litoralis]NIA67464.1 hypothetical protein [Pelagibius litoralis]